MPGGAIVAALDFTIFSHEHCASFIEEFAAWPWCIEMRSLSFGSLASYLNSLLSCLQFAHAAGKIDPDEGLLDGLINLRAQASKNRMYQPRHKKCSAGT